MLKVMGKKIFTILRSKLCLSKPVPALTLASMYSTRRSSCVNFSFSVANLDLHDVSVIKEKTI